VSDQHRFVSPDHFHPDPHTQSRTAERTLNSAIVHAEISRSYEEYLEIFDEFFADDIEGSSETMEGPIRGKARVRSLIFGFLVPLHAMAEVGGVSIAVRQRSIPGDVVDETHSAWRIDFAGVGGKRCTLNWRTFRKWNNSRVVLEHHYDRQQSGGPLSDGDLKLMCLSLVQVFPSRRECPKGVSGTGGRSKLANVARWPHIKCDLGPVGLPNYLNRAASDRIMRS